MAHLSAEFAAPSQLKDMFGFSRAETYRRLAAGDFEAIKVGARTHVNVASVRTYLASRPRAMFRAPVRKAA